MSDSFWQSPDPAPYPATAWAPVAAQAPAPAAPPPVLPPRPAPPLRTWGALVQVLLFVDLVAALAVGWSITRRLGVFNDLVAGTGSFTTVQSWDHTVHDWAVIELCLALGTGLAFITWFFRARRAAEGYNERLLRFGTGWAIGAWITPVLNLWRPPQMVNDVLNALETPPRSWHARKRAYPLVAAWWTVLMAGRCAGLAEPDLTTISKVRLASYLGAAASVLTVAGAVLGMIVVGRVTGAADRRRESVVQDWLATRR